MDILQQEKELTYSSLRNKERLPLERLLPLSFPLSIYIEVTNRCNFRCKFCPESFDDFAEKTGGIVNLDLRLYQRIIREIVDHGVTKVLRFYMMGEPLLNQNLTEMIGEAKREGIERTELTTNGTLLSPSLGQKLIDCGLDYIRISIYAVDQDRHERITGSRFRVAKIIDNIKRLKRLRDSSSTHHPHIYVKMIDSLDERENRLFIETYQEIGDEVVVEKPMNWNGYENRNLIENAYSASGIENSVELLNQVELYEYKKEVCPFPFYSLVINSNADVVVCCVDWNRSTKIGNLKNKTLTEIWNGEELRQFRDMQLSRRRNTNPSCKNCVFLYTSPDNLDRISPEKIEAILRGVA